ncbi:MAG: alanine racemase [Acidobacteriota bacterium]
MSAPIPIRPTAARVDLSVLAANYRAVREALGPGVGVIAVVKADAYGHGAVPVARMLEGLGVRGFGVATVEEGIELRDAGVRAAVLVMGAAFGRDHREVIERELTPMVGDPGDVERFASAARAAGRVRQSIHVKIDTGMSRLGVTEPRFAELLAQCASHPSIRVDGLATHFASADEADPAPTEEQLARFVRCLDQARAMGADPQVIHAANSSAALRFPRTRFDLVRPGIVLYGALPSLHLVAHDPGIRPVMSLGTRVNALREVPAGTAVSYGGTVILARPSRIATIPVGYADGYPRALSNRAQVIVRGRRAPVVGRVCMDLTMIDVTDVPEVEVGDPVTLLGSDGGEAIRPEELAAWAGTIAYEILCAISKRVPRSYVGEQPAGAEAAEELPRPRIRGAR